MHIANKAIRVYITLFFHGFLLLGSLLIAVRMASAAANSTAESPLPPSWQEAASLPYRVQEIYPAIYQQHIIVAGGLSPDVDENRIGVSDRVLVYSLKDKTWREGPSLPEPRHHPMLVVVNSRLLAFGGFVVDAQGAWHNSTDVLELVMGENDNTQDILQNGHWQKIAQLPAPLSETLSAVHGDKVHLVSGRTPINLDKNSQWRDQIDVASHYVFELDTLSWSQAPKIPTARNSACSVTHNGIFHTIAGRTVATGNLAKHEAYDFSSGQWQELAALPQAKGGLACAAIDDQIYVFGGEFFDNGGGVYSEVWQYDIATDKWRNAGTMPQPRHGLGALSVKGAIYVIAGALQAGGNQTSNAMTIYRPD